MGDRNAFDTVTRIAAGDDGKNYDNVAMTLHWLTALLVIVQFALGQTWGWFPRPTRHLMIATHMSFGIILTLVVLARVLWRLFSVTRFVRLRTASCGSLQRPCTMSFMRCFDRSRLGFLSRWEGNEAMSFFGLQIPPLYWFRTEGRAPAAGHSQLGRLGDHHTRGWPRASRALSSLLP